jgi:hypothetical protein
MLDNFRIRGGYCFGRAIYQQFPFTVGVGLALPRTRVDKLKSLVQTEFRWTNAARNYTE